MLDFLSTRRTRTTIVKEMLNKQISLESGQPGERNNFLRSKDAMLSQCMKYGSFDLHGYSVGYKTGIFE